VKFLKKLKSLGCYQFISWKLSFQIVGVSKPFSFVVAFCVWVKYKKCVILSEFFDKRKTKKVNGYVRNDERVCPK